MKRSWRTTMLGIALMMSQPCPAQLAGSIAPSHPATKHPRGFLDYALGKINPADKNYGDVVADARGELVDSTIQSLYFWSNLVSLFLLATTSAALIFTLRTRDKREIIAANLIAQLWNGRVTDRKEIVRRTRMYNALVEAKNSSLTETSSFTEGGGGEVPVSGSSLQRRALPSTSNAAASKAPKQASAQKSRNEANGTTAVDAEQTTTLLEGQNQALRNTERNLRERLNQVTKDLEQERRRNQSLKGA